MVPEIIRVTPVECDGKRLSVSTVKISHGRYDTVLFDDSEDKRHAGKAVGRWVIDCHAEWDTTRESAMDSHRDALQAARTEPIRDRRAPMETADEEVAPE